MRTQLFILFFLISKQSLQIAQAQTAPRPPAQKLKKLTNRTSIKFNVSGIIFRSYTGQLEYTLTPHSAFALSGTYTPDAPLAIPFKQALLNQYGDSQSIRQALETLSFTKRICTFEYRFYPAGKAPAGWYLAPFVRYADIATSNDYVYTPSDGLVHNVHLDAHYEAIGGGLLLGYQALISKHFGIDLWILGPFIGSNLNANFKGEDPLWQNLKSTDIMKLKQDIDNTQLPLYSVQSSINLPTINATLSGPYYGIRAFGLALAYSF